MRNHPLSIDRSVAFRLAIAAAILVPAGLCRAEDRSSKKNEPTLIRSPSNPLVSVRILFRCGSQNDPPGKEGLAALTAAMVAEGGTKSLTYDQLLERFYPLAASVAGDCRKEVTVFSGTIHRDNLDAYLPLLSEVIAHPRFAMDDFERLRNEALDYVTKILRGNNDEELGKWTLQVELYKGRHPYGHPDRGTAQGLKSITLRDVKAFHHRYYTGQTLEVGLAGGLGENTPARIEHDLAALPQTGGEIPALPPPHVPHGVEVVIVEKPAEATAISLGFPIDVTRRDDDFYALALANSYLGEHRTFNGKLMQDLRGKRGLNYGDYSYVEDFIQEGMSTFPVPNNPRRQAYFSIWIRPVPSDKAVFALRAALWELHRLIDEGMSPADFEATRSYLINYSKLWVQTLSRRLGFAMDGQFYGKKDLVSEIAARLPGLTCEQVNQAVRGHLKKDGILVAMVARDAAGLRDLLTSGKPTPLNYDTRGTPADIIAEDRHIAAFPLKDVTVKIIPVEQMFEK